MEIIKEAEFSPLKLLEEDKAAHPERYLPVEHEPGFEILYDGYIIGGDQDPVKAL